METLQTVSSVMNELEDDLVVGKYSRVVLWTLFYLGRLWTFDYSDFSSDP